MNVTEFEKKLGYCFKNKNLLTQALTHPSNRVSKKNKLLDYERFEFLGDSVLGLVITMFLIEAYPLENEGFLARRRSALICGKALAEVAKNIDLGNQIFMSHGEESVGGRSNENNLENTMEALLGAIFLDGGLEEVKRVISLFWKAKIKDMVIIPFNPKTKLQEVSQARKLGIPNYDLISMEGEAHNPLFEMKVSIKDDLSATGKGSSKKIAENIAAENLLKIIGIDKNESRS